MNGAITTISAPMISTENHTVLLPVEIWLGGMKLSTNASNEPQKPRPPPRLIISFYLAMNTANIWVLIDDGLDARAGVVLMGEDADKLTSYFKPEFIAQDPVLQVGLSDTSPYRDYEIRGYDHRVKMVSVWCQ